VLNPPQVILARRTGGARPRRTFFVVMKYEDSIFEERRVLEDGELTSHLHISL